MLKALFNRQGKFYAPYLYALISLILSWCIIGLRIFSAGNISDGLISSTYMFIGSCFGIWAVQATVQRAQDTKSTGQNTAQKELDRKILTGE